MLGWDVCYWQTKAGNWSGGKMCKVTARKTETEFLKV